VEICNLQGVIRQTIAFTEAEGRPVLLDINGNFMAVSTDTGLIKVPYTKIEQENNK
jgi:intraflagellar transport protein 140